MGQPTNPQPTPSPPTPSTFTGRLFADREATLRTLSTATSVLLLGTVVATLAVGLPQLRSRASDIRAHMRPVQVAFAWPPLAGHGPHRPPSAAGLITDQHTWVNAEIRRDVERVALGLLSPDPLDRDSLVSARDALLATGWFNNDLRLIRGEDNIVRVTGSWKVPVAAVRIDGPGGVMDQLVSINGELLPPRYPIDKSGMKVILGVKAPAPAPGKPFTGPEVAAGLRLLRYLDDLPRRDQVAAVDVSEFPTERSLTIITDLGGKILWGGAIDEFSPGQPPARVKLARLADVAARLGRIDAGRAVIDVRMTDGVYVHDTQGLLSADEQARQTADGRANNPR